MQTKYISIEDAAKRAGKEGFFVNVKTAVIPRLIEKGLLNGKTDGSAQLVADDEALARVMQMGIERFVYNQQGYSFLVVRAPIEDVARQLQARPGVAQYDPNITPVKMDDGVGVEPDSKLRHAFLIQMRSAPGWSALIQTVHWFHSCDAVMTTALACALSEQLKTLAAAGWDDDFSGSSLMICQDGKQTGTISDEDEETGWEGFNEFFHEHGIFLPELFIGVEKSVATLYVADPSQVHRADHVVLRVPNEVESEGPHVFEKIGMMADAIAGDIENAEDFMEHMHNGVWEQAQAALKSGQL